MNELRNQDARAPQKSEQNAARYSDAALMPPVDVIEDAHGITLYADLPGVSPDKLKLQVEAGTLSIEAGMDFALPDGLQSSHTEVGLGRFHRMFTLSPELDSEKVSAGLSNGVLRLNIPKADHAKPRRIAVKTA